MSKKLINSLLTLVLALSATAMGQQRRSFQTPAASTQASSRAAAQSDAATVFRSARDSITDGEWAKAEEKFSQYVSSYPNEKNLDAALYWLAYAEHKLSKFDEARTTIDRLLQKFPTSSWRDDARILLVQAPGTYVQGVYTRTYDRIDPASDQIDPARPATTVTVPASPMDAVTVYGQAVSGTSPVAITPAPAQGIGFGVGGGATTIWRADEFDIAGADDDPCEFKIVVLQALFQSDLQRGIMTATEWLKAGSTQTVRCKGAALTLLGRHGGKAATPVILGVARNEPDLKLRARAISTLGASDEDSVVQALRDFALTSQENAIVEASLYALSRQSHDRSIVVLSDIALNGKTMGHRKLAISSIATRAGDPAVDALFRIYDADQSVEIRKAVIAGFGNRKSERAGNKLLEIARSSDNVELRKSAISAISRRGGDKAVDFLLSLYDSEKNEELRDQIVSSLGAGSSFFSGDGYIGFTGQNVTPTFSPGTRANDQRVVQKFIDIARDKNAPMERRKRAIGWLSRSKDPKVLEFLQELLK
ncbi:MAG: HEAT repeat domain-containing protein [Acidobacteria bacterium]|nr:HEAT repeat domain-containing protein [Acidobacteriota bacterium]MCA1627317.1 HEAT repeat domain-containing protein [Acidobacteriota bacterium]